MEPAADRSSQMALRCSSGNVSESASGFSRHPQFRCTDASYPVPSGGWALSPGDSGAVGTRRVELERVPSRKPDTPSAVMSRRKDSRANAQGGSRRVGDTA